MRALALALRSARQGAFRCVLIDGEPGIGKTRLAMELLGHTRGRALALRARGHLLGSASPFGLWAELFDSYLRHRPDEEVRRFCGGHVADLSSLLRAAARAEGSWRLDVPPLHVREGLTVMLANLARQQPVIVLLDDMHLADASSWETLGYVARNLRDARVLVLISARLGELVEHAMGNHVLFGLEQDDVLTRLELPPLSEPYVRELAERVLGRPSVPSALTEWLFGGSRGNPLFALSLLDAVREMDIDAAAPRLAAVPPSLSTRVAQRVQALDKTSQSVLELLAVLGRPTDVAQLVQFLPVRTPEPLPEAITKLVNVRLVAAGDADGDPAYEVSHPLIQDCIYSSLDPAHRRALHRQIALVLTRSNRLGEAARHLTRSADQGDPEAVAILLRALAEVWARQAYTEAFVVLGSLLDVLPSGDQRWVDVLDAMPPDAGWLASYNRIAFDTLPGVAAFREIERALRIHQARSEAATTTSGLEPRLALANSYLSGLLGWCLGELEEAVIRARRANELYERAGNHVRARMTQCDLAWFEGLAGRYRAQQAMARPVLRMAEAANDHETALLALTSLFAAAAVRGDFEDASSTAHRLLDIAESCGNPDRVAFGLAILAETLALAGDLDEAQRVLDDAARVERASDNIVAEAEIVAAWEAGNFRNVAIDGPRVAGSSGPTQQAGLLTYAAMAAAEVGDMAAAHRHLDISGRVLADRRFWYLSDHYQWARGRVAWIAGDLDTAASQLGRAAAQFLDTEALPYATYVLADLAEAAAAAEMAAVAARAADDAEDTARRLGRRHFSALAALARSAAELAVGRYHSAAQSAYEATQLFAGGYRSLRARSFAVLGRSLMAQNQTTAVERLCEATELFDACNSTWRHDQTLQTLRHLGRPGQRAVATLLGPASLTERERQVAALAAQDMSTKAISILLHISERTVESHLAHAYLKFGVHSRKELAHAIAHNTR